MLHPSTQGCSNFHTATPAGALSCRPLLSPGLYHLLAWISRTAIATQIVFRATCMEATAGPAQQSGLLQLPAEVLHHIWRQCRDHEAQAALRRACTQLRQLADSFITSLYLAHAFTFGDGLQAQLQLHKRDPLTSIVPNMAATLQTFPAAAKLRTLHFNPCLSPGESSAPGVLSTFLHHVHHTCPGRFQHLASLTISCLTVSAGIV